jgi:hypothetical protein
MQSIEGYTENPVAGGIPKAAETGHFEPPFFLCGIQMISA